MNTESNKFKAVYFFKYLINNSPSQINQILIYKKEQFNLKIP